MLQVDDGAAAASVLVAQLQDIDPVIDRDRLGNLAGTHLLQHRQQLRLELGGGYPAHVATGGGGGGVGELTGDRREGGALLDLGDQLLGAAHRFLDAAGARGVDEDLADLIARLVGRGLQPLQHHGDLAAAGLDARAVAAGDHALPADLDLQLVAQGLDVEPDRAELALQVRQGGAVLLGQLGKGLTHLVIVGDDREFLLPLQPLHLLHLEMLVHQGAQRFLLDLGHVLRRGRHARGDDQQQRPLMQVVGGDDVVIDQRGDAAGDLGRGWTLLRRRGRDRSLDQGLIG